MHPGPQGPAGGWAPPGCPLALARPQQLRSLSGGFVSERGEPPGVRRRLREMRCAVTGSPLRCGPGFPTRAGWQVGRSGPYGAWKGWFVRSGPSVAHASPGFLGVSAEDGKSCRAHSLVPEWPPSGPPRSGTRLSGPPRRARHSPGGQARNWGGGGRRPRPARRLLLVSLIPCDKGHTGERLSWRTRKRTGHKLQNARDSSHSLCVQK